MGVEGRTVILGLFAALILHPDQSVAGPKWAEPLVQAGAEAGDAAAPVWPVAQRGTGQQDEEQDEDREEALNEALFQEAVERALVAARFILDDQERDRSLAIIAKGIAEVGRPAQAVDIAHEIEGVAARGEVLAHAAEMFLEDDEVDAALAVARHIQDPGSRSYALRNIVEFQAREGDMDAARETAEMIEVVESRAVALSDIAELAAERGDGGRAQALVGEAIALAESVAPPGARAEALNEVARAQVVTDGIEAAAENFERAIEAARGIAHRGERERVLYLIGKGRSQSPDLASSEADAAALADPAGQAFLWREIGKELGEFDRIDEANEAFERALSSALRIEEASERSRLLGKVAEAMVERADNLERALAVAELAPDAKGRDLVLLMIVGNLGEAKQNGAARQVAGMLAGDYEQLVGLVDIAKTSAELGDRACAQELLDLVTDERVRELDAGFQPLLYRELAEAHTKVGDPDTALKMADRIGPHSGRAQAFSAIAEILMQKRRGPPHSWPWPRSGKPAQAAIESAC